MGFFQSTLKPILDLSTLAGLKVVCNGDSITAGTGSTAPIATNGWFPQLCTQLGAVCVNQGVSSKTLQAVTSPYSGAGFNAYTTSNIPTFDNTYGLYIIALGVNDSACNDPAVFTVANFEVVLRAAIDAAVAKGWPLTRLLISAPTYFSQAGLNSYVGIGNITTANTLAGVQLYRDACLRVAQLKNILFWDLSQPVINLGNRDTYLSDNVHPAMNYHSLIPTYVKTLTLGQQG